MLERSTTGDGDEAKRAHAFSLVTPLRTYLFSCDSDLERDEWRKVGLCLRLHFFLQIITPFVRF